jgi:hypothetical protein
MHAAYRKRLRDDASGLSRSAGSRPYSRSAIGGVASVSGPDNLRIGGDGGIRTLDRALQPYNGLANRRLQPLGHISGKADMPDAGASRKRQISGCRISHD